MPKCILTFSPFRISFSASLLTGWVNNNITKRVEGQAEGQAEEQAEGQPEGQAKGQPEGQAEGQPEGQHTNQPRNTRMVSFQSILASNSLIVAIFAIFYLAYVILFGIKLNQWKTDELGHCYRYNYTALPHSSHPQVDKVYLGITCFYMVLLLIMCFVVAQVDSKADYIGKIFWPHDSDGHFWVRFLAWAMRVWLVFTALLQFPLHLYMVIALRAANEKYLEVEEDSEQTWGFGQVVALVLVIPVLREYIRGRISKGLTSLD